MCGVKIYISAVVISSAQLKKGKKVDKELNPT